ncbi:SHOCT domain-containing protein [Agrobacterium vitis]|uniref:SHOCT domain-containing protein n=1 Tax=Agrobacterium vitis TaxID=373 RepID=A0AAE5AV53_AGRVI|nr:SHOCT domain-containing protein [Agrobacterium vitis]MCF1497261.1 SHOCT domain-containing protein [Allorhizobium sp. Av2]MCM2439045.1 SHOCT domain-containing protein [Agrobacterium vitis]MUZ56677.1 SHOCT domain-containing protein [Agrobacterium vitis]MVA65170.1 SHOCT domain-containing protein [Agrobacterium vitis]MVA86185.1 SHOCT domain-containing protein [Agrobacterium vitis]
MPTLSDEGQARLSDIATRHGVSFGAVEHLLMALMAGNGYQAQFNHPDLGGMGQWSQGGMTMVGDMFNNGLKARVDNLCSDIATLLQTSDLHRPASGYASSSQSQSQGNGGFGTFSSGVSLFIPGSLSAANWWPADLGFPASTGAQNNLRYAFFPSSRRLAIDIGGRTTVYDTRDHQIGGFSQQQGGDQTLSFTSQYGLVRISELEVVSPGTNSPVTNGIGEAATAPLAPVMPPVATVFDHPEPASEPLASEIQAFSAGTSPMPPTVPPAASDDEIFAKIEKLAALHGRGILTDKEYQDKKADLLSRL